MTSLYSRILRTLIVTVGSIAGWLLGQASGPLRLELPATATGLLGGVVGAGVLIVACLFALSRREKRNLCRNSDRHFVNMIQSPSRSPASRGPNGTPTPDNSVRDGMGTALAVDS